MDRGVPGLVLIENAAAAVIRQMAAMCRNLGREKVLVLRGKGTSGGDGLAVSRRLLLLHPELDLRVVLFAEPDALSGDARTNWRMLKARDHNPLVASTPEA